MHRLTSTLLLTLSSAFVGGVVACSGRVETTTGDVQPATPADGAAAGSDGGHTTLVPPREEDAALPIATADADAPAKCDSISNLSACKQPSQICLMTAPDWQAACTCRQWGDTFRWDCHAATPPVQPTSPGCPNGIPVSGTGCAVGEGECTYGDIATCTCGGGSPISTWTCSRP